MGSHLAGPRIRPGLLTTLSGLCVAGTAAGVLTARLRRRLMTADVLSRTGLTLGSVADVSELRAALASALGDETLDITCRQSTTARRGSTIGARMGRVGGAWRSPTVVGGLPRCRSTPRWPETTGCSP